MKSRSQSTRHRRKRPVKRQRLKREHLIYGGATLAFALFVIWVIVDALPGQSQSGDGQTRLSDGSNVVENIPESSVILFYVAEDGTALVEHEVEVPLGETALARARIILEKQLSPPESPLISPFPEGTELRAIYLTPGGDAFIDLSQQISVAHPGGSLDELFTVYALVNVLTRNFFEISAVQILIEGQEVDTLAGHVDLRRPLGLNMKWVSENDATTLDDLNPAEG
jgi:hypothetical protein